MAELTPQDRGRQWEKDGAKLVGGRLVKGSGNSFHARGDVKNGGQIVWSFKHTIHNSFSVTRDIIEDARSMALGPMAADSSIIDVLAYKMGDGTMRGDLDLMTLIAWIAQPPEILPATKTDSIRATARTPNLLRGTE